MSWSISKVKALANSGKIRGYKATDKKPTPAQKKLKAVRSEPKAIGFIKDALEKANIAYEVEYYFAKPRMFRFDIAVPEMMLAVEYEGLVATGKKGGHQTKAGFTSNCTKYNLAAQKGWKLYRYTCRNYKDFESDLKVILK